MDSSPSALAERRVQADPWDVDSWNLLLQHAERSNFSTAKPIYERLVARFPPVGAFWRDYAQRLAADAPHESVAIIQLYERAITRAPSSIDLWRSYNAYMQSLISLPASPATIEADAIAVHERALSAAGLDLNANVLWSQYIELVSNHASMSDAHRSDALRKIYQRAVMPLHSLFVVLSSFLCFPLRAMVRVRACVFCVYLFGGCWPGRREMPVDPGCVDRATASLRDAGTRFAASSLADAGAMLITPAAAAATVVVVHVAAAASGLFSRGGKADGRGGGDDVLAGPGDCGGGSGRDVQTGPGYWHCERGLPCGVRLCARNGGCACVTLMKKKIRVHRMVLLCSPPARLCPRRFLSSQLRILRECVSLCRAAFFVLLLSLSLLASFVSRL